MKPEQACVFKAVEYFKLADSLLKRNMQKEYELAQAKAMACLELADIFITGSQGANP